MRAARRLLPPLVAPAFAFAVAALAVAEEAARPIDLASTLKLAGANAVEVRIAEERLRAAQASATVATWQLLPWLSVGASFTGHGGLIQDVTGNIVAVEKHAYTFGPALVARVDVGDAIFRRLAALQTATAAEGALASQRQKVLLRSVQAYLDLLVAQASAAAAEESLAVARDYEGQLHRAVEAGIALKGDELRVRVQTQRSRLALEQARQERRVSAARLAELLRLGPAGDLAGRDDELIPLALEAVRTPAASLVDEALAARPEVKEAAAGLRTAEETEKGARLGPLVPALGFQAFVGGLGGGREGIASESGSSRDYVATIAWRVGPGGLFDLGRTRLAEARRTEAQWAVERVKDVVGREVVEAQARAQSGEQQLAAARDALRAHLASLVGEGA
ncbi:MAG TPA: TolC family protein, partial [Vicinamibacteria bacterium]|nr:TolC family protein [Vicinamibacteria bacterium]